MSINGEQMVEINTLASNCLTFLANDVKELTAFMDFAGYETQGLRKAVGTKELNLALFEYFAKNDALLMAMSANFDTDETRFIYLWQHMSN